MRKTFIGAIGLFTVIIVLCFTGCKNEEAAAAPKPQIIHLRPGRKLVSCDWNTYSRDVMYLTRPIEADEKAIEYEYQTLSGSTLYILREADRERETYNVHQDLEVLQRIHRTREDHED